MIALIIIITVILFILLLRLGVIIEYSDTGFFIYLKAGVFSFNVYPGSDEKVKKKKLKKEKDFSFKPGSLNEFLDMLKIIKKALSRLKRKLLVKHLVIKYIAAGSDPAETAMSFGASNAVLGIIMPVLEKHFKIKKRDISVTADFESTQKKIYLKLAVSIAVWELLYVGAALLPLFKPKSLSKKGLDIKDRKGVLQNG